jgi:hypothetical protein
VGCGFAHAATQAERILGRLAMVVDFFQLPVEDREPADPPSKLAWSVVFALPFAVEAMFKTQGAGENGDGTVPMRSGRAPEQHVKACFAFNGFDHEGAYDPSPKPHPQQLFALLAITRIISNVKGTTMEYAS